MDNIKLNSKQTAIIRSLDKILEKITNKSENNKLKMEPFSSFCRVDNSFEGSVFVNMEEFESLLISDTPNPVIVSAINQAMDNDKFMEKFNLAIKDSYLEKEFSKSIENGEKIPAEKIYDCLRRLFKIIANAILSGYTSKKNKMTSLAIEIAKSIANCYSDLLIYDNDICLCMKVIDKMKETIINNCNVTFSDEEKRVIEKYLMEDEDVKTIKKFYNYNKKLGKNYNDKLKLSDEMSLKKLVEEYESALDNIKKSSDRYRNMLSMYKKICNNIDNSNLVKRSLYNYILSINDNENNKKVIKEFMILFMDGDAKQSNFMKIIKPTFELRSVDKKKSINELAGKGDFDSVVEILSIYVELLKVGDLSSVVVKNVLKKLINCMDLILFESKTLVQNYDISIKNFERFINGIKYGNKINFVNEDRFVEFNLNAPDELKDAVRANIANMISYAYTQNEVLRKKNKADTINKPTNNDRKNVCTQSNVRQTMVKKVDDETSSEIKKETNLKVCSKDEFDEALKKLKYAKYRATHAKTSVVKTLKKDGYEKAKKKLYDKIDELIESFNDSNMLLILNYLLDLEYDEAKKDSYYLSGDVTFYKDEEEKYIKDLIELECDCSDYNLDKIGMRYDGVKARRLLKKIEESRKIK